MSSSAAEAVRPVLLALADDELIMGHRHSEWTGWAPHIEEDIAFSSIAQDEIGHATLFYKLISELTGESVDSLGLGRAPEEYRNAIVCERPNRDWAYTLARHFLYEIAERIRLESLSASSHTALGQVCDKLLREERYHQIHADGWFDRLCTGPVAGKHEFSVALGQALPDAVGLFEPFENETDALGSGVLPASSDDLLQMWLDEVTDRIGRAGLPLELQLADEAAELLPTSSGELVEPRDQPEPGEPPSITQGTDGWVLGGTFRGMGGRRGAHSRDFAPLWEDLTLTYREEPSATW